MERTDPVQEAAARRREELDQRIQELHQRNSELAQILMNGHVAEDQAGSSQAQVSRAEELARLASQRAIEASKRATAMYLNSAAAHERAARMHTLLAENGARDPGGHRQRAREHLRLAAQDRETARAITAPRHTAGQAGAGAGEGA